MYPYPGFRLSKWCAQEVHPDSSYGVVLPPVSGLDTRQVKRYYLGNVGATRSFRKTSDMITNINALACSHTFPEIAIGDAFMTFVKCLSHNRILYYCMCEFLDNIPKLYLFFDSGRNFSLENRSLPHSIPGTRFFQGLSWGASAWKLLKHIYHIRVLYKLPEPPQRLE